ncbi:transcriptional regulator [Paenibacillus pectinilyticus]|uniref:Transcriptional regulator n=1 Tax=Paenibacillus pectinilyticus TaxID=512399 RepID=A0A1C0ZU89_9BACL|nr:metalloregulator ArsR/SmtB family transcription factor [Paenibacillus pectinilyticus]OCT11671.1 transcriptional regulator [Paenibacillus pectinilyticus]
MDKGLLDARPAIEECDCQLAERSSTEHQNELTDAQAVGIAEIFKALGDPTRVKIINFLLGKELCVHDIATRISMEQSAVSHQLRYLRDLHIVKRRKEGKTVYYALDDEHIEQIFVQTMGHLGHR